MEDIRNEIRALEQHANEIGADAPRRADLMQVIGIKYGSLYGHTTAASDLGKIIHYYRKALDLTPTDGTNRAGLLRNIGAAYLLMYRELMNVQYLVEAITHVERALEAAPTNDPNRAQILRDLAVAYGQYYEQTREREDLNKCNSCWRQVLELSPPDSPGHTDSLNGLIITYYDKYKMYSAMEDLERTIQYLKQILVELREEHPARADHLQMLGSAYRHRYEATSQTTDLENAMQHFNQALERTHISDPKRGNRLHWVATGYFCQFQATGDGALLDKAIAHIQESVSATPEHDDGVARRFQDVGGIYHQRWRLTGGLSDLEFAIDHYKRALRMTPAGDFYRPQKLRSLGKAYHDMQQRTGSVADIEEEIRYHQEALDATDPNNLERPNQLQDLGAAYATLYQKSKNSADLERAIQYFDGAVQLIPKEQTRRAGAVKELGTAYAIRSQTIFSAPDDLKKAIGLVQESLEITTHGHPDTADRLQDLGTLYTMEFNRTKRPEDISQALKHYQDALSHASSPANTRFRSGMALVRLYANAEHWVQAARAASDTVSLVPLLTPRFLQNEDKQHILADVVGLASDAAAAALQAGETAYEAIRLLELGRGIITGSITEIRADIRDLQQQHPDLAAQYLSLRKQLDSPKALASGDVDSRYHAGQALECLLHTIRQVPGFERFLLPHSEDEIQDAAKPGPIVIINVSKYRCDALIVESNSIRSQRLPDLHETDIQKRAAKRVAQEDLEWLWRTVAGPILKALGCTRVAPDSDWPHIWWVPTGALTRMPIHAAGDYTRKPFDSVLDSVISSYSTSIKTIVSGQTQHRLPQENTIVGETVLIGMPKTPGYRDLRYALDEIQRLENIFNKTHLAARRPKPVQRDVLTALDNCEIFHFAGHGHSDLADPLQSCLVLEDYNSNPLTVSSLLETNIHNRRPLLAYLSACGTGQVRRSEFADEGMHLMAACQVAGFQNVIGTMWAVNDLSCADMASKTYQYIVCHGMSNASVSEGLHHATRWLRTHLTEENDCARDFRKSEAGTQISPLQQTRSNSPFIRRQSQQSRDLESVDDTVFKSMDWVPYIHYGVRI